MGLILKLAANALYGLCIISVLLVVGFAANLASGLLAIALLAAVASGLVYLSARRDPSHYGLYGLAHIALPLLFVLLSRQGDADATLAMRLYWFGILGVIYAAGLYGGRRASRRLATGVGKG